MRKNKNLYLGLIIFLLTSMAFSVTVFAKETVDTDRSASLSVECAYNGNPLSGVIFDVYKVADIDANGAYTITDAFSEYSVYLEQKTVEGWRTFAQTIAPYALRDRIPALRQETTNLSGRASFSELSTGMYLVSGHRYSSGDFVYIPDPFLVSLPSLNEHNEWYYDIEAKCKGTGYADPPETTMVKVLKVWNDGGHESNRPENVEVQLLRDDSVYDTVTLNAENNWRFTWSELSGDCKWSVIEKTVPVNYSLLISKEGVTFVLTNSYKPTFTAVEVEKVWSDKGYENKRPTEIEVQLLCEEQVYDTVVLNVSNGWSYSWSELEKGRDWSVKEKTVPEGYTAAVTQYGGRFTITNTYTPSPPPDIPDIPQTGQLRWPIPVLIGAGLVCYLVGFVLVKARKKHYE